MKKLILGDCLDKLREMEDNSVDSIVTDPPYGLSFMGKKWDYDVPSTEIWRECLRVLKPGGHLLSFAGSRTYHRMAVNIEDAGFEVRDQLMWIYGSGFPKSHNIGKAVDKKLGNEREIIGENPNHRTSEALYELGFQGGKGDGQITKGNSEWEGWGTALKPAHEPIVMARKPLSEKTVVDNVLEWGTGGINIDESRIGYVSDYDKKHQEDIRKGTGTFFGGNGNSKCEQVDMQGRFPANVLLSEEAAENLDEHSGISKSSGSVRRKDTETDPTSIDFKHKEGEMSNPYAGQVGGASRYFYVAKPSKKEKEFGMTGEDKILNRVNSGGIENDPKWKPVVRKNSHPTVKPIKLMEYLITMVTPKGGITLDPFMGSGSTGIAALQNGFQFIGIEREQEYMDIAEQRINSISQLKLDI
jgi:site-specific DNA-methyltransferase (adenine-specific)